MHAAGVSPEEIEAGARRVAADLIHQGETSLPIAYLDPGHYLT